MTNLGTQIDGQPRSRNSTGPFRTRRRGATIALTVILWSSLAFQTTASPGSQPPANPNADKPANPAEPVDADPQLNDASVDRQLDAMRRKNGAPSPVAPKNRSAPPSVQPAAGQSADPVPGMAASDFGVPGARRLREGAFISRRPGKLLKVPNGDWVFVPRPLAGNPNETDPGTRAPSLLDRPLVVLPSQTLERLEHSMGTLDSSAEHPSALLSGQIFTYRDREYVLPQQPSALVSATEQEPESAHDAGRAKPGGTSAALPKELDDAAVKELIRDLETRRTAPRALTATGTAVNTKTPPAGQSNAARSGNQAGAKGSPVAESIGSSNDPATHAGEHTKMLMPEGSLLTSRRGRVVRLPGGELAFAVEGDAQSGSDPAMTLLPSATLQRLEDLILWRGERQVVEVSGRVTSYGGKNYLMPTIFVVPPPTELGPLQ